MASGPEKKVKDACVAVIKAFDAYYFFPPSNGMGRAGIPDIIVCHRGKFLGVECKAGYNKPSALQEREIHAIHKAGGSAMVIREDTVDMLKEWFTRENEVSRNS